MKRMNPDSKVSATADAKGFLDFLATKSGAFQRRVDAMAFGAAYAMHKNIDPEYSKFAGAKSDLVDVNSLSNDVRLALECGIHSMCKKRGLPLPEKESDVLSLFQKNAEAGLYALKGRWEGKSKAQILDDVRKLVREI